jgi:ribosomal-protein-alanine N-acetyltransferase
MEGLSIDTASLRDVRQVMQLERACFGKDAWPILDIMGALVWPGGVRLKAMLRKRIIGLVIAEPAGSGGVSMITTIGVDPAFRRRGIASALLSRCEELLPGGRIRLTVRADNSAAIRLYERFGYAYQNRLLRYYRDGQAGLVMEKDRGRTRSAGAECVRKEPGWEI